MPSFYFPSGFSLEFGGAAAKARDNMAALRLVRQLEEENREATFEEQLSLARYTGWGDSQVFREGSYNQGLEDFVTNEEERELRASTLNAHYTALPIVRAIWSGCLHLGLENFTPPRHARPFCRERAFLQPAAGRPER